MYYVRPRIVISTCLVLAPVRYDGNIVFDECVEKLRKHIDFVDACPEVIIGLEIPQKPLVLSRRSNGLRLIDTITGADYTDKLIHFAENFSNVLPEIDVFILKYASPSCGVKDAKIYDENKRVIGNQDGLFTLYIRGRFRNIPVEPKKALESRDQKELLYEDLYDRLY